MPLFCKRKDKVINLPELMVNQSKVFVLSIVEYRISVDEVIVYFIFLVPVQNSANRKNQFPDYRFSEKGKW